MVNDNYSHSDMPKYMEIYSHNPIDVLSLRRRNWLTDTIINTFFDAMDVNLENGTQKKIMNIFYTPFYSLLTTTTSDDVRTPQYNTYNMSAVRTFTDLFTADEFLKTFFIPIRIPGHWLLCIIDPVS